MARGLKFRIQKEEGLYYLCSENKGADRLRCYREADLRLCFAYEKIWYSHDEAHIMIIFLHVSDSDQVLQSVSLKTVDSLKMMSQLLKIHKSLGRSVLYPR